MKIANLGTNVLFVVLIASCNAYGQEVKTVYLKDTQVAAIPVLIRGTVLSLPTKATKVILGNTGSFGIEYVENDLAISPLKTNARSNLFVYMLGRRFTFDLRATESGGQSIVVVRDAIEAPQGGTARGKKH
ncbi:MAG: hypothetical protein WCI18_02850 [Pseudomonadota bacterium]